MSSQVEYRRLGSSGLRVSVPILGAMSFGSSQWAPWVLDEDKALELLKAAWDLGVTTIDTANIYSEGESERIIGKFIKQNNIPREKLVILSKCRYLVSDHVNQPVAHSYDLYSSRDYLNHGGLSRAAIFNQVNASLARLDTSYIDLLQIHYWDDTTPVEETMRALHDLVIAGKVRYLGSCNLKTWQLAEMNNVAEKNGWTKFVSTQVEHSLLYRTEEPEMFEYSKYHGVGIIPYAPLLGGSLARPVSVVTERNKSEIGAPWEKKLTEPDKQIVERVEELAKKKGWTMAQVALAWSRSKTTSPIVGVNSPERLKEALIADKVLSPEEEKYLEELYVVRPRKN